MESKERIRATLERRTTDRPPVDLWHTPEVGNMLRDHTGAADDYAMYKALGLDKVLWFSMEYKGEEGPSVSQVGGGEAMTRTMWGAPLQKVQAGAAVYHEALEPPMLSYESIDQIADYPWWPDPDRFDYEKAVGYVRHMSKDFPVNGPWISFFEIYCKLRGIEQSLMDLAIMPDFVDAVLDRIEAIQTEMLERFLPQVADAMDMVFISDDIGGQNGPLMSPASWKRHLEPRMRRWCKLIHDHGLRVFYHTDGGAEPLLEGIVDAGIDVLNPIQHACPGMAMDGLKEKYGDRVIFHGGVDNQTVLPFASADAVRRETEDCLAKLGAGGTGYICCSCHNVQPGTPLENILAMIETVREWRA